MTTRETLATLGVAGAFAAAIYLRRASERARPAATDSGASVGLIGLGVMGAQFLLNLADKLATPVAGLDIDPANVRRTLMQADAEGLASRVRAHGEYAAFVGSLQRPRVVLLLVPAGRPVDLVCDTLLPLLSPGDVVVDHGNSHFEDTERRQARARNRHGNAEEALRHTDSHPWTRAGAAGSGRHPLRRLRHVGRRARRAARPVHDAWRLAG
jgi:hypothetical protein